MSDFQDSFSLAGLEYCTVRDYVRMFSRRKWFISVTTFTVALATAVVVYFLPNVYKATTVILIEPQKVPDYYVNSSTVSTNVADRVAMLRQEILSETRLNQIIDEMHLYPKIKKENREKAVRGMQKNISVSVTSSNRQKDLDAFSISYTDANPVVAAEVANRLASLFIEDNIQAREQSILGTTDFLSKEVEDAQKDLKEKEDQITALKTKYAGELPESEMLHVEALNTLQPEIQSEKDAIAKLEQQKIELQSQLSTVPTAKDPPEVATLRAQLSQLNSQLDEMRSRYGPSYPDVIKENIEIRALQKRIEDARKTAVTANQTDAAPASPADRTLESQIAALNAEILKHQQKEQEVEAQVTLHESELGGIPLFQQQMSSLTRDYDAAEDHYKHLLDRKFSADMAADLEVRQKGERFEILDPAQVPANPDSPNRPLLNLGGLAAGLLMGFAGALGLQLLDPSVQTEREIINQLRAPVFAEVLWLPSEAIERQELRRAIFAGATSATMAAAYSILMFVTWR